MEEPIKKFKPKENNILEVLQWTGRNIEQVQEFCGEHYENTLFERHPNGRAVVAVDFNGTKLECNKGQYLGKSIEGFVLPLTLEDLLETHEEVIDTVCTHTNTHEHIHEDGHRRDTITTTYCSDCGKQLSRF